MRTNFVMKLVNLVVAVLIFVALGVFISAFVGGGTNYTFISWLVALAATIGIYKWFMV